MILAVFVATADWCLFRAAPAVRTVHPDRIESDLSDGALYEGIAGRVRRGHDYYRSASDELRARGYPIHSVFNWRLPVYAWLFGAPIGPCGAHVLLLGLVAASAMAAATATDSGRLTRLTTGVGLVAGYGWLTHPYPAYFTEVWAGLLVFLSCVAFGVGRSGPGIAACAAAVGFRELALPYVAVVGLITLRRRSLRELIVLSLIVVAFFVAFALHYRSVVDYMAAPVSMDGSEWVEWGGTPFVLSTCRMNFLLALLPPWCAALYLPLAVLGLVGSRAPTSGPLLATVFIYVGLFAVVGTAVNYYWGWMLVPPLWVGFVLAPRALADLFRSLRATGGGA